MILHIETIKGVMTTTIECSDQELALMILEAARKEFGGVLPDHGNVRATSPSFDINILSIREV